MGDISFVSDAKRNEEFLPEESRLANMCDSYGHVPSGRGSIVNNLGVFRVSNECQRCHEIYKRRPSEEEMMTYREILGLIQILKKYRDNQVKKRLKYAGKY